MNKNKKYDLEYALDLGVCSPFVDDIASGEGQTIEVTGGYPGGRVLQVDGAGHQGL